jgi:hypothetical protein
MAGQGGEDGWNSELKPDYYREGCQELQEIGVFGVIGGIARG